MPIVIRPYFEQNLIELKIPFSTLNCVRSYVFFLNCGWTITELLAIFLLHKVTNTACAISVIGGCFICKTYLVDILRSLEKVGKFSGKQEIPCVLAKFPVVSLYFGKIVKFPVCPLTGNLFCHFPCFPCAVGNLLLMYQKLIAKGKLENYIYCQCPKLRVHPAPSMHISTAGCTILGGVHPVCARFLSH